MTQHKHEDETIDRAVDAVRADAPDAEVVRQAADRVWAKLSAEMSVPAATAASAEVDAIAGCDDYQALIPAYLAGELPAARRLLLEDHSRECVACRRALIAARSGAADTSKAVPTPRPTAVPFARRWAPVAAAAVLLLAVAVGWFVWNGTFNTGPVATVAAVDGSLLAVEAGEAQVQPLYGGAVIGAGAPVRTAKDSSAVVKLPDGSSIEMAERTQIRVRERLKGTTIYVDRGSIIVEAADQRPRHLYVATDEALVSVTGTIFAVQHGVKGSRVSVVEGEVHVRQGQELTVLHPGQQVTTRPSLAAVPVEDEIAWSRNGDRYVQLLSELSALRREIAQRVAPAELRFASDLTDLVPADTLVYVALPNLSGTLAESYDVFRERLASSPVLASWWQENGAENQAEIEDAIGRLRDFGSYLGDEIVIALAPEADRPGEPEAPVFLATVERSDSFRAYLEAELARINAEHDGEGEGEGIVLVDDPSTLTGGEQGLLVWVGDGLFVASPDGARLRDTVAAATTWGSGFAGSELGQAVTAAYADGTQWLVAVDLATLMTHEAQGDEELSKTGFDDLSRLVVERWDEGERAVMTAELTFAGERHGIASWLAAPAPMGAMDFVSSQAHLAAAWVVKEPTALLDDVATLVGSEDHDLSEIESELGLSLRDDFAAPLGGEMAFALDGPFLPEPSWKLIVEVYDPATLQHTIETAVAEADRRIRAEGGEGVELTSETAGGHTFYRVGKPDGMGLHYVFVDGYAVVAPSRALLERTLDQRAAGDTLTSSARFRDLLPRDGQADFSALFFQHVGPLLAPMADTFGRLGGELTAEQSQALSQLAADAEPTLAYAYGEADRITVAGTGPGGPLGLGVHALTGAGGLASLGQALAVAAEEAEPPVN